MILGDFLFPIFSSAILPHGQTYLPRSMSRENEWKILPPSFRATVFPMILNTFRDPSAQRCFILPRSFHCELLLDLGTILCGKMSAILPRTLKIQNSYKIILFDMKTNETREAVWKSLEFGAEHLVGSSIQNPLAPRARRTGIRYATE